MTAVAAMSSTSLDPLRSLNSRVDEIAEDLIACRRDIHAHPELAWEETRTTMLLADRLEAAGAKVQLLPRSGLIAEIVPQELPDSVLARIRTLMSAGHTEQGQDGRLLRLAFAGDDSDRPLLSEVIRRFGIDLSIVHGQVDEIQGKPFGTLAVFARGAREPAAGHRVVTERERVLPREPKRNARGPREIALSAKAGVRPLTLDDSIALLAEPPECAAETVERFRRVTRCQSTLEGLTRGAPVAAGQRLVPGRQVVVALSHSRIHGSRV